MAVLSDHGLSLEVAYIDRGRDWVDYNFWLRWHGAPIVNPAVLDHEFNKGAIRVHGETPCGLLGLLERAMAAHGPNYCDNWESEDQNVDIKISMFNEYPTFSALRQTRPIRQYQFGAGNPPSSGPLDSEPVDFILLIYTSAFEGDDYSRSEIMLRMTLTRLQLRNFYDTLTRDYAAILRFPNANSP